MKNHNFKQFDDRRRESNASVTTRNKEMLCRVLRYGKGL